MLTPCKEWSERLSAYLDGELPADERAAVEAHLRTCDACRAGLELLRVDAQDAGAALLARGASEGFADRVLARVEVTRIAGQPAPAAPEPPRRGFRWAELLVAVGVIAIVAAVVSPVFSRSREKARQSQCMNNQKQLVLAVIMYADSHEQRLPEAATVWDDIKIDRAVLRCTNSPLFPGYAYNAELSGKYVGEVKNLTNTHVTFDAQDGIPAPRHGGKLVVSYLDGHVEMIKAPTASAQPPAQPAPMPAAPHVEAQKPADVGRRGEKFQLDAKADRSAQELADRSADAQPTIAPPEKNYGLAEKLDIAYTASLGFESPDVRGAMLAAEGMFREYNGFVLNSTYTRDEAGRAAAKIDGRVPAEHLGAFLVAADELGELTARTVNGEDLTAKHLEQMDSLLKLGQSQRNSAHIGQGAGSTDGRVRLEERRNAAAREATGVRVDEYRLKSRVRLAEVSIALSGAATAPATAPGGPGVAASRAWHALRGLFAWLLEAILIPGAIWSPVWAPLLGVVLLGWKRRWWRKGKAGPAP